MPNRQHDLILKTEELPKWEDKISSHETHWNKVHQWESNFFLNWNVISLELLENTSTITSLDLDEGEVAWFYFFI